LTVAEIQVIGFFMAEENEQMEFWKQREEEKGGELQFNTFATFIGRGGDKKVELGGLLYIINNRVYFEDFEKDNIFLKILSKKKAFKKTEFSFDIATIRGIREVSAGEAANCIQGLIRDDETKKATGLSKFFSNPVLQLVMEEGYSFFFDIMRRKEFIEIVT